MAEDANGPPAAPPVPDAESSSSGYHTDPEQTSLVAASEQNGDQSLPPSQPSLPALPGEGNAKQETASEFKFEHESDMTDEAKAGTKMGKLKKMLKQIKNKFTIPPEEEDTDADTTKSGRPKIRVLKSAKALVTQKDTSRLHNIGELSFSRLWPSEC